MKMWLLFFGLVCLFSSLQLISAHYNGSGHSVVEKTNGKLQLMVMDTAVLPNTIAYLQVLLQDSLNMEVGVVPNVLQPPLNPAFRLGKRYVADSLLGWLQQAIHTGTWEKVLCLTTYDIGSSLRGGPNKGILGLSYIGGCCAVASDYRLHQYNRPRDSVDYYLGRVALHEVAHTLGLGHCASPECIMENREDHYAIGAMQHFCKACRNMLQNLPKRF